MKSLLIISVLSLVGSCATKRYSTKIENLKEGIHLNDSTTVMTYANTITAEELKVLLYDFTSEDFRGRKAGTEGQKKASNFLKSYYKAQGIHSPINDSVYFQNIPAENLPEGTGTSENVIAYIKGTEKPDEVIIISAHLDHLGVEDGKFFNGADDNGSGTSALMEMAQAFKLASENGLAPKRSVLFLHLTAEEIGLQGSQYYMEHPIFDLENTIANLNIDMIGRIDNRHKDNSNYLYLIGSDRISKELHYISEKINNRYFNIDLDYTYNDENDRNRYYYRSDHYNFAAKEIPVIFYFNGEHDDYHLPTDTPNKIEFKLLEKRTRLIFATAWHLANMERDLIHNINL
jgi:hypothetical protein